VEWFESLYDDFRQRTGFGSIPAERTVRDVDFILEELRLKPGSRVLDVCSGTGRHTIELAGRDVEAIGVELNPDYVALAEERSRQAGVKPRFVQGDVRTVEFGSGYDGAILMWNSFGYFSDDEDRDLIGKVAAALRPGGRFLIELLNRDY
jgi:cyclopropane fatty-acyl-phospholipid synthase-like methyltransferase